MNGARIGRIVTDTRYDAISAIERVRLRGRSTVCTKPPIQMIGTSTTTVA